MFILGNREKALERKLLMVEEKLEERMMQVVVAELLILDFQMETGKILVLLNRELS
jgi:hypothetical protein